MCDAYRGNTRSMRGDFQVHTSPHKCISNFNFIFIYVCVLSKMYKACTPREDYLRMRQMSHGYHYDQATHGWQQQWHVVTGSAGVGWHAWPATELITWHLNPPPPTSSEELRSIDQWNNSTLFGFAEIIQAGASSRVSDTPPLKKAIPRSLGSTISLKPCSKRTPTDSEYDVG